MTPREWYDEARRIRRDFLAALENGRSIWYDGRDSALSTDRAIMRGGPGAELSPPAGSSAPHEAKS